MKNYLNQEQREAIALLVDSPEMWAAVKRVIEHHVEHYKNRVLTQLLADGADALVHTKARYEGVELLSTAVVSDIERTAHQEAKASKS